MTNPHVTYGDLMHDARRHVIDALASLRTAGLRSPDDARTILALRTGTLVALRRNATTALGPARTKAVLEHLHTSRHHPTPAHPDPAAVAAWLRTLPTDDHTPDPKAGEPAAAVELRRAIALVNAASDLLATHTQPAGGLRPVADGTLATPSLGSVIAAPARLCALLGPTEPFALQARAAGLARDEVDELLPLVDPIEPATWTAMTANGFPPPSLDGVRVAHPAIRHGTPAVEWSDRLDRVTRRVLARERRGDLPARTAADIARLGLVTTRYLATTGDTTEVTLADTARSWATLLHQLSALRSLTPHDSVIRHDVQTMVDLTADQEPDDLAFARALTHGLAAIGTCSRSVERQLTRSTDLWSPPAVTVPNYLKPVFGSTRHRAQPAAVRPSWPASCEHRPSVT
jgi:hypothetical protein